MTPACACAYQRYRRAPSQNVTLVQGVMEEGWLLAPCGR